MFGVLIHQAATALNREDGESPPRELILSGFADMPSEVRQQLLLTLVDYPGALLLLFDSLAAREDWQAAIAMDGDIGYRWPINDHCSRIRHTLSAARGHPRLGPNYDNYGDSPANSNVFRRFSSVDAMK